MIGEAIAEYVTELDLSTIPQEVMEKLKLLILDTLCVGLGGSRSNEALMMKEVISCFGGKPESTVFCSNLKLPAPHAALINATMAHCLELDDTDRFTYYHPGSPVIMTALALSEEMKGSGKRMLEGILAGYEISVRIADAVNPSHRDRGFHTTGTIGTFGAGMAAAKILGLNRNETINALGISGTQAAGLFEFLQDGSMTKRIHPGKGAWNGILAVRLAKAGMTGPATILEGTHGFLKATSDEGNPQKLTDGLGETYRTMRIGIKRHASCRYTHTQMDAALELKKAYDLNAGNIEKVIVQVSRHCFGQTAKPSAETLMAAQLSTPYCVALSLAKGSAGIDDFRENLSNPAVLSLMNKIEVVEHPPFGGYGRQAIVSIATKDGRLLKHQAELPKGEPEYPLSLEEVMDKGSELTKDVLGKRQFSELTDCIVHLEELDNLDPLLNILR